MSQTIEPDDGQEPLKGAWERALEKYSKPPTKRVTKKVKKKRKSAKENEKILTEDDVLNVIIDVERVNTVDEFLEKFYE